MKSYIMKTSFFLTTICFVMLSITVATAQSQSTLGGSNYGNPCLTTHVNTNTLKTKNHVSNSSNNRFNAHKKFKTSGSIKSFSNNNYPPTRIKKHRITFLSKINKNRRKGHRHRDRGDKQ